MMQKRPMLTGYRVLDFTQIVACGGSGFLEAG